MALATAFPGLRRFEAARGIATPDGSDLPYQRIAELTFDDMDALQAGLASEEGQAAVNDIPNRHFSSARAQGPLQPSRRRWAELGATPTADDVTLFGFYHPVAARISVIVDLNDWIGRRCAASPTRTACRRCGWAVLPARRR